MPVVAQKFEIEAALHAENQAIRSGELKEDSPLDLSEDFRLLCEASRRGDLKGCQQQIEKGVNLNAKDKYDYTPLILASLCGHYEVVQLLLESGALCERDTFQGERCLYNALTDRIRNLLLEYDYSKSTDPLQPFAAHITSLLSLEHPKTADITLTSATSQPFHLHKFVLAARSPYFASKLKADPSIQMWKISNEVPGQSFNIAMRYLYLAPVSAEILGGDEEEQVILLGVSKISKHLEIDRLFETILPGEDRRLDKRLNRQRRTEELERGNRQFESWFRDNVLKYKIEVETSKADNIKWDRDNAIYADVLLRADEEVEEEETTTPTEKLRESKFLNAAGIPIGPKSASRSPSRIRNSQQSVLFPAHRAMLLRSEFFATMFSSSFREAQETPHLQIIPIACSPRVLQIVLTFLYTERAEFGLKDAIDVLFAADLLFIDKLKVKAATIISTLGNNASIVEAENSRGQTELEELIDIFDVVRAGWDTRVQRLEEFGARYIAQRLERYIDQEEFAELVRESAGRVKARQQTDTVELIDDIRYYLSERFRLRFEDTGLDEMTEEEGHEGAIRTLDGEIAGDEFDQDSQNYQLLLGKIDTLLDNLELDA